MNMLKEFIKWLEDIILLLTNLLFSIIPVALILGGGFVILGVLMGWFFEKHIITYHLWYISFAFIAILMGFKWDDAIIEYYPIVTERKKFHKK